MVQVQKMVGKNTLAYFDQSSDDEAFREITSVFRHDFVQYAGMIQSWTHLIEAVVLAAPDQDFSSPHNARVFRRQVAELNQKTEQFLHQARRHLHTERDPDHPAVENWQQFQADFIAYAHPRIQFIERLTQQVIAAPDFETIVERTLGASVPDDTVKGLLLRPFSRLREVLDTRTFDRRIGDVLRSSGSH